MAKISFFLVSDKLLSYVDIGFVCVVHFEQLIFIKKNYIHPRENFEYLELLERKKTSFAVLGVFPRRNYNEKF